MKVRFDDCTYEIPEEEYERFEYLKRKVAIAQEGNWEEMLRGYTIVLKGEYKKYMVQD